MKIKIIRIAILFMTIINTTLFGQFTADNDGIYNVSPTNGFLNYTYPISNTTIDGFPMTVNINYVGDLGFVAFCSYQMDYNNNNLDVTKDSYTKLARTNSAWIIGVNGFAIQVLTRNSRFHSRHNSYEYNNPLYNLDKTNDMEKLEKVNYTDSCHIPVTNFKKLESDFVWMIDGYDFCNNLESPTKQNYQDVIHILKDDGSILELRNIKTIHLEPLDQDSSRFVGLYYNNAINSNSFAIVEYDTTNFWPTYLRSDYNYYSYALEGKNLIKPRKLKYYTGDGLEYVFREYVAPYGLREDLERKKTIDCDEVFTNTFKPKATIFYLEEINSSNSNLTKFKRNYHKPTESNFEVTRGRSLVREFANHKISYSPFDIHIESFGKVYTLNLGYRGIEYDLGSYDPYSIKENLYYPLTKEYRDEIDNGFDKFYSYGINHEEQNNYVSKNLDEEIEKPYRVPSGDGLYYVLKIIDPMKREISFDYESVYKKMDSIPYIFDNTADFLYLHTFRINKITSTNKITEFEYKEDSINSSSLNKFSFNSKDTVNLDCDKYSIISSVKTKDKWNDKELSESKYEFYQYANDYNATIVKIIDKVNDLTEDIHYELKKLRIKPFFRNSNTKQPDLIYPIIFRESSQKGNELTIIETDYKSINSFDNSIESRFYIFPASKVISIDKNYNTNVYGQLSYYEEYEYEYEFENLHNNSNFPLNEEKYGSNLYSYSEAFGFFIKKMKMRDYLREKEITTSYKNIPFILNQTVTRYSNEWLKYDSDYYTTRNLHFGIDNIINIFNAQTETQIVNMPPIYGLIDEIITKKLDNTLISASKKTYDENIYAGPGNPPNRRGALLKEEVKFGPTGTYFTVNELDYKNGWDRSFLSKTQNAFGAVSNLYYNYSEIPGYDNTNTPKARILLNTQDTLQKKFLNKYYQFEAPLASESIIRKYRPDENGSIVEYEERLQNIFEKNYFGQVTGLLDANGWYYQSIYDDNGRKILDRQPYDFPVGNQHYSPNRDMDDCVPITQSYLTTKLAVSTNNNGSNFTYTESPEVTENTFKNLKLENRFHTYTDSNNVTQTTKTTKSLQLVYEPSPTDAFHNPQTNSLINKATLDLFLLEYPNNCVGINIKSEQLNFEANYVIGCPTISNMPNSCVQNDTISKQPILSVDLNPVLNLLKSSNLGNNITFGITLTSDNAFLTLPDLGQPYSPCIKVTTTLNLVEEDDYTYKYNYNDINGNIEKFSKVDDAVVADFNNNANKMKLSFRDNYTQTYSNHPGRYTKTNTQFGTFGNVLKNDIVIGNPVTSQLNAEIIYEYTGLKITDPSNQEVKAEIDDYGRVTKVINEDNTQIKYSYKYELLENLFDVNDSYFADDDEIDLWTQTYSTNEIGITTNKFTDKKGRVRIIVIDSSSKKITTKFKYDNLDRISQIITPLNQSINYTYDDFGNIVEKSQVDIGTLKYKYDILGRLRFSQNQEQALNKKFTYYQYDDLGRTTITGEATYSESSFELSTLNPNKLAINSTTDYTYGNPTLWQKNGSNKVNKIVNFDAYDSYASFIQIRNNGNILTFDSRIADYINTDADKLMMHQANYYIDKSTTGELNNFENIADYPQFVNTVVHYDDKPAKFGYIWENMPQIQQFEAIAPFGKLRNLKGQKTAVAYRSNSNEPFHYLVYSYDARGRVEALLRYTENLGFDAVYYTYNSMNKITSVTAADALKQFTVWYDYDDNGRVQNIYSKIGENGTGLYTLGNPMSYNLRYPVPQQFVNIPKNMIYTYNIRGGVDKIEYPEFDVTKEFVYNARGFVSSLVAKGKNGQVLFTQSLGRDYMGNILQQTSQHIQESQVTQTYTYDDLNRLTAWNNNSNNSETYTYDDMGNRTAATKNGVSHTYSYGTNNNRLSSVTFSTNIRNYSYNGIGAVNKIEHLENNNLVLEEFFEYNSGTIVKNYRKKNYGTNFFADVAFTTNPTTYTNNEWQWSYRQSALGGREQKRLLTSPHSDESAIGGKIFAHLWEYSLLGAGGEELIFYKGFQVNTNTSAPSNDAGRRVYMGVQRYMVNGGEIQINANGEMELHITDHLGNVRVITNKTGTVLKKFDYKPFGEILWSNSPTPRKGFESAELDSENGYITMGARTYCQDIGRFLQPDPLFEAFARHTPYHYSYNSPLVWLDPSGLAPEKEKGEERLLELEPPPIDVAALSFAEYQRHMDEKERRLAQKIPVNRLGNSFSVYAIETIYYGNDGEYICTTYTLMVPTSWGGYVPMDITITDDAIASSGKTAWELVKDTMYNYQTIVDADPSYFDNLSSSNPGDMKYNLIIQSGAEIANYCNETDNTSYSFLLGLNTSHSKYSATFRVAAEFYSNNEKTLKELPIYSIENWIGSIISKSWSVWEIIAHESGHHLDYIKYDEGYDYIITPVGRELYTIDRVNGLREFYGMSKRVFIDAERRAYEKY